MLSRKVNSVTNLLVSNVKFVTCDVTSWKDQLAMFRSAIANSPRKCVDIVVANAGISGPDPAFTIEGMKEIEYHTKTANDAPNADFRSFM